MIAIKITQQKNFMAKLLTTDMFDAYLVEEAIIETFNTFTIDGRIHKDFYKDTFLDPEQIPSGDFSSWGKIRPICLDLIKGKQTPLGFKFVLHLGQEAKEKLLAGVDMDISPDQLNLGINIKLSQGQIIITTGMSTNIFTMDKSAEKAWDEFIPSFLESNGIETDLM